MTKTVKLSPETLGILKNASTINKSLAFKEGNEIKTISASGAIVMEAKVSETFPCNFAVYELQKLLGVLALPAFKEAELVFEEDPDDPDKDKYMIIKAGSSKIKWYHTEESFVEHPGRTINLPNVDVELTLQKEVLENFEKAAAALGHKTLKFKVENKKLYLVATTPGLDTSSDYIVEMGDNNADDFEAMIKLENLKLVPGDFKIQLLKLKGRGISRWEHLTRKIVTFIGLELQ